MTSLDALRLVAFDPVGKTITFHDRGQASRTLSLRRLLPRVGLAGSIWTVGPGQYLLMQSHELGQDWVALTGTRATTLNHYYGVVVDQHPDRPNMLLFMNETELDHGEEPMHLRIVELLFTVDGEAVLELREETVVNAFETAQFLPGRPDLEHVAADRGGRWQTVDGKSVPSPPYRFQTARGSLYTFTEEYEPMATIRHDPDGTERAIDRLALDRHLSVLGLIHGAAGSGGPGMIMIYQSFGGGMWDVGSHKGTLAWTVDEHRVWSNWDRVTTRALAAVLPAPLARYVVRATLPSPL